MSDLHGQIMNIPCVEPDHFGDASVRMAYRVGHRDARHAAAELALGAEARAYASGRADEREESAATMAQLADALKAISKLIPVAAECPRENVNLVEYTDAEWVSLCAATVLVHAAIEAYEGAKP